jgi:hypothetical protein
MEPSFALLFKRGKYRSFVPVTDEDENELSEKERDEKRREIERYLTTAIGFCAKHDRAFRAHLLTSICGIPERFAFSPVDISVEAHPWGDLVLASQGSEFACVVECKVHAKLLEHQNPETPDFERTGYGARILEAFKSQTEIRYVILGWYQTLSLPKQGRIIYLQKDWSNLADNFPRHRLAADLYSCLATLGVPAFLLKETQNMKLGTNTKYFAQAITLLPAAAIEAGLDERATKFDCAGKASEGWWYFGVTIKRIKQVSTARYKLQNFINPKQGNPIGWYGYYQEERAPVVLATWLYCGNAAARRAVKNRLVKNGIKAAYLVPDLQDDYVVDVRAPLDINDKEHPSGDRLWFSKVLKAAMKDS